MSDVDVMAAIIERHVKGKDPAYRLYYRATTQSSIEAAKALYDAGFRMKGDDTQQGLIGRLSAAEARITRLEGWAGLPQ